MVRRLILLLLTATPALAAERSGRGHQLRPHPRRRSVRGAGHDARDEPNATVAGDARALDGVTVRVDGGTLIVRASPRGLAHGVAAPLIRVQTTRCARRAWWAAAR